MFVDTRIRQLRKSVKPLTGPSGGSFGERQLNADCGLSPLNGVNRWFVSESRIVTVPFASASCGVGEEPRSQLMSTLQFGLVGSTPSHCSTDTSAFGAYPVAMIENGCGFPLASPGTTNGEVLGVVIAVTANAAPAVARTATVTMPRKTARRDLARFTLLLR